MQKPEHQPHRGGIQNFFYGPVGQYIEHVEHNHFGMNGDGEMTIANDKTKDDAPLFPKLPDSETMRQAVVTSMHDGYWWGNRSWAVVYRVYQMKGYMKGIAQFVSEVESWKIESSYTCNYDAVQKPIIQGKIVGPISTWRANGVPEAWIKLAEALLAVLK